MRTLAFTLTCSLCLAAAGPHPAAKAPEHFTKNQGTATLLNGFTQGWGLPGPLVEVSPGTFAGLALLSGQSGRAFTLTSQGVLTSIYTFPGSAQLYSSIIQAVNGRLYGSQFNPNVNFSLNLAGSIQTYPQVLPDPPRMAVQTVTGEIYGTVSDFAGLANNSFVAMTLSGVTTVLHAFTTQEGIPYGYPILASDGNFYGISGIGNQYQSTSSQVYRATPQGAVSILATYPDGRPNYAPGSFPETLLQANNGKLYGVASLGGSNRAGAIFELSLSGTYKVLHEYNDRAVGVPTFLMQASDGNLYGATAGPGVASLFKITLDGQFQTYYVMNNPNIGTCTCWLTQGSDGLLYGTTQNGGPSGAGTAWTWNLGLPAPLPALKGSAPSSGAAGTKVTLYGYNLLGATAVSFNGTPATTLSNISANYVSATVPPGATTGPITVTTPNGSSTSTGVFTVE